MPLRAGPRVCKCASRVATSDTGARYMVDQGMYVVIDFHSFGGGDTIVQSVPVSAACGISTAP